MTEEDTTDFGLNVIREKLKHSREQSAVSDNDVDEAKEDENAAAPLPKPDDDDDGEVSWSAVAGQSVWGGNAVGTIEFSGKNLEGGKFVGENLENASFSVANLTGFDF